MWKFAIAALVSAPVTRIGGESNGTVLATRSALAGSNRPVPRARSAAQETVVRRAAAPAHARALRRKVDRRQSGRPPALRAGALPDGLTLPVSDVERTLRFYVDQVG